MGVGEKKKAKVPKTSIAKKRLGLGISNIHFQKLQRIPLRMVYKHRLNGKAIDEKKISQKNFCALSGELRQLGPARQKSFL